MGVPRIDTGPMNVEEFLAFTDSRPDDEKWELIDGEPVLNATPTYLHQTIVNNIYGRLLLFTLERPRSWAVFSGFAVRVSGTKLPVPDVMVRPNEAPATNPMSRECDDMIVAFEVLSQSTSTRDLRWKRAAYTGLASLTHYVVVAQDSVDVVVFARDLGFEERRLDAIDQVLSLPSLGVAVALSDIYRDTGLA